VILKELGVNFPVTLLNARLAVCAMRLHPATFITVMVNVNSETHKAPFIEITFLTKQVIKHKKRCRNDTCVFVFPMDQMKQILLEFEAFF
jgi:hypothetical protein